MHLVMYSAYRVLGSLPDYLINIFIIKRLHNLSSIKLKFKQKISKKYNLTKIYNSNIYVYTLIKNVYLFCSHVFRIPLNNCVFLFINFYFC